MDEIHCLDGVGELVYCYDLNPGDIIAGETGEPTKVIGHTSTLISTEDGNIEIPEGMRIRRLG